MSAGGALCPVCDQQAPTGAVHCPSCGGALVLDGRWTLERLLGAGGQSRVYAGRDSRDGAVVAVKVMSLARVRDWKNVDLFRRAASVLGGLSHPGIPRLVAYFEEKRPGAALYCLVHEFIEGETLAQALAHGARFDEASGRAIAREVLGILGYLHGLSPPVIHRDLKPSNLMRRPDGRLVLIDFDLVRDLLRPEGGSTVATGTPGYAPMEQFVGEAVPATDLYALGATLAALLSRKEPLALRRPGGDRLEIRGNVNVSDALVRIMERLVEPEVGRRYQSAAEVLRDLDRPPQAAPAPPRPLPQPVGPPPYQASGDLVPRGGGRTGLIAASAAGTLLLLGAGVAVWLSSARTPAAGPPQAAPPAVATPTPDPAPPTAPDPPPPPAPKPPRARKVALARGLDEAAVEKALDGSSWEGSADGEAFRLRFLRRGRTLAAEVTSKAADDPARGRAVPYTFEASGLGTITLRGESTNDGVTVRQTFFGDLTEGLDGLVGTRERHYTSAGNEYTTEAGWSARRTGRRR